MFELDPDWDKFYMSAARPRPPQKILCKGVVVGHRHEDSDRNLGEHVVAVGSDPDIQAKLDVWWAEFLEIREREREARRCRFFALQEEKERLRLAEARRAIFGEKQA